MINNYLVNLSLTISGILLLIFVLFPDIDISISSLFYDSDLRFFYKDSFIIELIFRSIPLITKIFVAICFSNLIYVLLKHKNIKSVVRSWAFFLCITAAIAPAFTVNYALKENFGRARPKQIKEFARDKTFSRAFVISDQCDTNCSFSSGHAAMAFYFSSIAYIVNIIYFNRVYLSMLIFGFIVGLSRIAVGGHFASDVIASCFIVLLLNHLTYLLWKNITSKWKK
ncbi:phosphatase PAP2 family protein [Rickettsiaceae bacterium]|nr:phosphatase PAP2 family protein [Rickettsiaceae bacterium]